jgi:hypothetical protein
LKGPFGLVIAAGIVILVVAVLFSLAPSIGGEIDEGNPLLDYRETMSLINDTDVATEHRNIGSVIVSNKSDYTTILIDGTDYSYQTLGSIKLLKNAPNYDGTYYVEYDYSRWGAGVNTDLTEGGDWYSDNTVWVTLLLIGIIAVIIIGMFMRW